MSAVTTPVAGNTTRVNASDLTTLSNFLQTNFNYTTGPFDSLQQVTPGKPWMKVAKPGN